MIGSNAGYLVKIFSEFYETILKTLVHCASTQLNPAKSEQYTSLLKLELLFGTVKHTTDQFISPTLRLGGLRDRVGGERRRIDIW